MALKALPPLLAAWATSSEPFDHDMVDNLSHREHKLLPVHNCLVDQLQLLDGWPILDQFRHVLEPLLDLAFLFTINDVT